MATGIPAYFKILVRNVDGTIAVDPLPHPHQAWFETIAAQPGSATAAAVGNFEIPLFSPAASKYASASVDYAKLQPGQRVEFYALATPTDPQGVIGTPRFTGIITQISKNATGATIRGSDSLYLLQMARGDKIVSFNNSTDTLFRYGLKGHTKVTGDGCTSATNGWTLANFTNNGSFTTTTDDGFNVIQAPSPSGGDGLLYTTTSYGNTNYSDCIVHGDWRIVCESVNGKFAAGGVLAAVADANNYILGEVQLSYVSATQFRIDMNIWQKTGGVSTLKATTHGASAQTADNSQAANVLRGGVHLIGVQLTTTTYLWWLRVNNIEANVRWVQTVGVGSPTGSVGVRANKNGSASGELAYCKQFWFANRTALFQPGSITAGSNTIASNYSFAPNLDILNDAISTEGFFMRKNPVAGSNQDTLDFAASPGTDLSGSVTLEEAVNLSDFQIEPNAEPLATALIFSHAPNSDNSGQMHWVNLAKIDTYGWLMDTASAPYTADMLAVIKRANKVLTYRTTPDQAKRITVIRTSDLVEQSTVNPSGLRFRELDYVTLHIPRLGLYRQKVQVLSFKWAEGNPAMEMTVDQWPRYLDNAVKFEEWRQKIAASDLDVQDHSAFNATLGGVRETRVLLPINPYCLRVLTSAGQGGITNQTWTKVQFDVIDFDPTQGWDATNYRWTVPITGRYAVSAIASDAGTPPTVGLPFLQLWRLYIHGSVSGDFATTEVDFYQPNLAGYPVSFPVSLPISDVVTLQKGELIEADAYGSLGIGIAGTWGLDNPCRLSLQLIDA